MHEDNIQYAERVEKHIIDKNNMYYKMLMDYCHRAKNLYNQANYIIRQEFVKNSRWIQYNELDKIVKSNTEYPDYANMPTAQSAQQTLRLLEKNWKSFFHSVKEWKKHPEKYLGRPKLPKYKKKDGKATLILTNQNCKLKDNVINFPKKFGDFKIKAAFSNRADFFSFQQIRILPQNQQLILEVIYKIKLPNPKQDNNRYLGIDIGVNNLATVCSNTQLVPFVINGRGIKSVNQYYNKKISYYREICKRMNNSDYSARMNRLTRKRNNRIEDYMHKASRFIINKCIEQKINTIVIGNNKEWKQGTKLSSKMNQHFVQIPHMRLIGMIKYKAEEKGITVILTEESYTSGTSFLDNELPVKDNYNNKRRKYRGLFVSNSGKSINADLNGAYQIIRKVFPKVMADGIEGVGLHPVVVNVA